MVYSWIGGRWVKSPERCPGVLHSPKRPVLLEYCLGHTYQGLNLRGRIVAVLRNALHQQANFNHSILQLVYCLKIIQGINAKLYCSLKKKVLLAESNIIQY